jgi:hypothetical protein
VNEFQSGRLRDERNQEKLIRNQGNWISEIGVKAGREASFNQKFKPKRRPKFVGNTKYLKGKNMKIYVLTTIAALALPFMALGQTTTNEQQTTTQGQTKETQTTAPAKGKKMRPAQEQTQPQAKPETGTNVRGQTNVQGRTQTTTTVNKDEFRSRHTEVFSLGRHPKEFFVQRYGASHFRLIGNSYFVFVDGCWVAVDVDGFTYTQRVVCPGEPDFVEVVD